MPDAKEEEDDVSWFSGVVKNMKTKNECCSSQTRLSSACDESRFHESLYFAMCTIFRDLFSFTRIYMYVGLCKLFCKIRPFFSEEFYKRYMYNVDCSLQLIACTYSV